MVGKRCEKLVGTWTTVGSRDFFEFSKVNEMEEQRPRSTRKRAIICKEELMTLSPLSHTLLPPRLHPSSDTYLTAGETPSVQLL